MLYNLTRIDNESISIHKFSPELQFIIRIFILFKNLTSNKACRTISNSIHRCKVEFHDFKKGNKTDLSLQKSSEKSKRSFVIKSFDKKQKFLIKKKFYFLITYGKFFSAHTRNRYLRSFSLSLFKYLFLSQTLSNKEKIGFSFQKLNSRRSYRKGHSPLTRFPISYQGFSFYWKRN